MAEYQFTTGGPTLNPNPDLTTNDCLFTGTHIGELVAVQSISGAKICRKCHVRFSRDARVAKHVIDIGS
jgi:hypothetical protein